MRNEMSFRGITTDKNVREADFRNFTLHISHFTLASEIFFMS